jgi:peptidoglycan/LPS O-acetylase OafA/YrhL
MSQSDPSISGPSFSQRAQIPVLDALRFVAAFWVVISHAGLPPLPTSLADSRFAHLAFVAVGSPFCGIAAVMLFFIISGFCIHFPVAQGRPLHVGRFYAARFTRIGLPLVAALLIFLPTGLLPELHLILWSIYCEILYYLFYPLLRLGMKRWSASHLVIVSSVVCFIALGASFVLGEGLAGRFASWGAAGTSLIGLPVWLGGCLLASVIANNQPDPLLKACPRFSIWTWRVGILGIVSICNIAHFHTPLNYKLTMPLIGLLCVPWVYQEMQCSRPPVWMASAGKAGYSIYLMHQLGVHGIVYVDLPLNPILRWILGMTASAVIITVFYFVVEKPSHRVAKYLSQPRTLHPIR